MKTKQLINPATYTITLEIEGKSHSMNYRDHFGYVVSVSESMRHGIETHFRSLGLRYVDVPALVGITGACENIDTLYRVQNRSKTQLFFAQTGQLALEQALQSYKGVHTAIISGRDEAKEDERHLRQFRLIEEEFDCNMVDMNRYSYDENIMFEHLIKHIEMAVKAMLSTLFEEHLSMLLGAIYKRTAAALDYAVQNKFLRISYTEAIDLLNKKTTPTFGLVTI